MGILDNLKVNRTELKALLEPDGAYAQGYTPKLYLDVEGRSSFPIDKSVKCIGNSPGCGIGIQHSNISTH